jgi:hypothetical protein
VRAGPHYDYAANRLRHLWRRHRIGTLQCDAEATGAGTGWVGWVGWVGSPLLSHALHAASLHGQIRGGTPMTGWCVNCVLGLNMRGEQISVVKYHVQ